MSSERKIQVARFFGVVAFGCGLIGLVVGLIEREWRMGVTGWFTGGTLLAALAMVLLVDALLEARRRQPE